MITWLLRAPTPGDRAQQLSLGHERGQAPLHVLGQRGDHLLQIVQVHEDLRDDQRVVSLEVPGQRSAQRRKLGAQLAFGQFGEQLGVTGARQQGGPPFRSIYTMSEGSQIVQTLGDEKDVGPLRGA
jgi:hypothetical protein